MDFTPPDFCAVPKPQAPRRVLILTCEGNAEHRYDLCGQASYTVGRDGQDISLNGLRTSKLHAVIFHDLQGKTYISALGSSVVFLGRNQIRPGTHYQVDIGVRISFGERKDKGSDKAVLQDPAAPPPQPKADVQDTPKVQTNALAEESAGQKSKLSSCSPECARSNTTASCVGASTDKAPCDAELALKRQRIQSPEATPESISKRQRIEPPEATPASTPDRNRHSAPSVKREGVVSGPALPPAKAASENKNMTVGPSPLTSERPLSRQVNASSSQAVGKTERPLYGPAPPPTTKSSEGPVRNGGALPASKSERPLYGPAPPPGRASGEARECGPYKRTALPAAEPAKKSLKCDKCDGPHPTDSCPHFKKKREDHKDAWANYGKNHPANLGGSGGNFVLRGARVVRQPGDGSCLFHSLCHGLNKIGERSHATQLRHDIARFIQRYPKLEIAGDTLEEWVNWDANTSVTNYAQRMAAGRAWGGGIEIAACALLKKTNIHVYENRNGEFKRISCFNSPHPTNRLVHILYQGGVHYDALALCR
eukprot:TRINITY_DN19895_c0_g1_i1.p1 TRINITY_DN19895_c0_g1~~TRINITY_DN19895_c0_g1_i1.p1  ORF type:complete len:539 (+),score=51.43 TRINITY_DN19895_c0_g1_i1:94-1710(+)